MLPSIACLTLGCKVRPCRERELPRTFLAPNRAFRGGHTAKKFARTDVGNAHFIAHHHRDKLKYDSTQRRWFIWSGQHWQADTSQKVLQIVKAAVRLRFSAAYTNLPDGPDRQAEVKWCMQSEHVSRISAALTLAEAEPLLNMSGHSWDNDPLLLGVKNGVIDLRTGLLRPGRPRDLITLQSSIRYDPAATAPTWDYFIHSVFDDPELIAFLQRAIGYCLTGLMHEQCLFLCYGEGANGKSTFLETIRYVLGGYACNLPFSAFEQNARSSISNDIAALPGRRFVTANETNEAVWLNEARIKSLTSSDAITCRRLYQENFTFHSQGKIWLAFNHKPLVRDDSHGFWRRIRLIPFIKIFDSTNDNPHLGESLRAEAAGILNWCLEGVSRLKTADLNPPKAILEASKSYRLESDSLNAFIADKLVAEPGAHIESAHLWETYTDWAKENMERYPLSRQELARRLIAHGFTPGREGKEQRRVWRGVRLADVLSTRN